MIRRYFDFLRQLLIAPTRFFATMPLTGGISGPLTFALITHWIGTSLQFLWNTTISRTLGPLIDHVFQVMGDVAEIDSPGRHQAIYEFKDRMLDWMWGVSGVLVDPFTTFFTIVFVSALVFIGARLFVTPNKEGAPAVITYESALRIVCYAQAPSLLRALPFVGGFAASIMTAILLVIGAKQVYRVGTARATAIGLFPQLLLFSLILAAVALGAILILKFFSSMFTGF